MRLKSKYKFTVLFSFFITFLLLLLILFFLKSYFIKNFKKQLLLTVELSSKVIDRDILENIVSEITENKLYDNFSSDLLLPKKNILTIEQSYSYQDVAQELRQIREMSGKLIYYAYIIFPTKNENYCRFLIDADITPDIVIDEKIFHEKNTNVSPFTKLYDISNQPFTKMALNTKLITISENPVQDDEYHNKSYMAFAPIYAKSGKYIGTLGIDMSKKIIDKLLFRLFLILFSITLPIIFLLIFIYYLINRKLINPLYKLAKDIGKLEEYDFNSKLEITSNDIISRLRMEINRLIEKIKNNTVILKSKNAIIQKEKEEMMTTLRSIADGVIIVNDFGNIIFMNRVAENILEYAEEEVIGKPIAKILKLLDKNSLKKIENPALESILTLKIKKLEENIFIVDRNNNHKSVSVSTAPVIINEKLKSVILVIRDIRKAELMESELINAQKLESLNILTSGIAHDFNNFLTAIVGNTSILKYKIKDCAESSVLKIINRIEDASIKANGLSQQLLLFSKKNSLLKKNGNIFDLIKKSMKFSLSGRNVMQSIVSKGKTLPVNFNPSQMTQVFNNLFINAAQSMPGGGNIECYLENVNLKNETDNLIGKFVKISISDQGKGIPKENLEKIFEHFFTTKSTGSGIGLSVVKRIVTEHGGNITVDSTLGKGTTFNVYLPAVDNISKENDETKNLILNTNPKNIVLIMDDEYQILEILSGMLEMMNYKVISALKGEQAIYELKKYLETDSPITLAILDKTIIDGIGGIETAKRLKELDPNIKIILSSGYASSKDEFSSEIIYFNAFLSKPYKIEKLNEVIKKVMLEG